MIDATCPGLGASLTGNALGDGADWSLVGCFDGREVYSNRPKNVMRADSESEMPGSVL